MSKSKFALPVFFMEPKRKPKGEPFPALSAVAIKKPYFALCNPRGVAISLHRSSEAALTAYVNSRRRIIYEEYLTDMRKKGFAIRRCYVWIRFAK